MKQSKFPVDASINKVIKALNLLGFKIVREKQHISMIRENADGTRTPLTLPNHKTIKSSTLRTICTQSAISRDDFIDAFNKV
jgi:predicted RNA binding protein YcfA (HicA-like mRNA interferase family)